MFTDEIRGKLENIIRGVSLKEQPDTCTTIRNNLCASYKSDPTAKKDFESKQLIKEEQAKYLKEQALTKNLWIATIPSLQWFQSRSKTRLFEQGYGIKLEDMHDENVILKGGQLDPLKYPSF